jgi:hypothetical protein
MDDNTYQPYVTSLRIVEKIPGSRLVLIKNAGRTVMNQYPAISKIMDTFLLTMGQNK